VPKRPLTISEQAGGILTLFGPHQLMDFIGDVMELYDFYNVSEEDEQKMDDALKGELCEVRLARTAITLSKIADKHGKALRLINCRYPGFHAECQKIADSISSSS
jgi:hypothetical protein